LCRCRDEISEETETVVYW